MEFILFYHIFLTFCTVYCFSNMYTLFHYHDIAFKIMQQSVNDLVGPKLWVLTPLGVAYNLLRVMKLFLL